MSTSSIIVDSGKFFGLRTARAPADKSNFSQTCNLLSQYMKEKGTLGDLSLGMSSGFESNRAAFFSQTVAVNDATVKFEIWDTAGQERYHSLAPMYYRGAAAAIIVYDITNQLPAYICPGITLVISPLVSLIQDQM